ncbi:mannosyl phosphorylinositol ceramide synthase [Acrasis kona]|uniref:Mannosyl phosphorylinositol ceramide synthase n=1 Tax=Acrasis kona TaxID=1008807 RepID=A0AAW2YZI1_9EUKA
MERVSGTMSWLSRYKYLIILGIVAFLAPLFYQFFWITTIIYHEVVGLGETPYRSTIKDGEPQIPSIVHLIWKNNDTSTYPHHKSSPASWKARYPEYIIKIWTDEQMSSLVEKEYTWLFPLFKSYEHNVQRADVARLVVLHHEGGIYSDLDSFPNHQDLGHWRNAEIVVPANSYGRSVTNHFLMAKKGSKFIEYALHELHQHNRWIILPYLRVFWSTGPLFLAVQLKKWMKVHPDFDFVMIHVRELGQYVTHSGGRSWHSWDGYMLNLIADNPDKLLLYLPMIFIFVVILCFVLFLIWRLGRRRRLDKDIN